MPQQEMKSTPRDPKDCEPSQPIDVDDALIEDPKDDAFKKKDHNQDSKTDRKKERGEHP